MHATTVQCVRLRRDSDIRPLSGAFCDTCRTLLPASRKNDSTEPACRIPLQSSQKLTLAAMAAEDDLPRRVPPSPQ